jgi:hypothetical protein
VIQVRIPVLGHSAILLPVAIRGGRDVRKLSMWRTYVRPILRQGVSSDFMPSPVGETRRRVAESLDQSPDRFVVAR